MSDTLYSRICALGERDVSRFHMPGHKGKLDLFGGKPFARYDLTEIPGADSLYDAEDVIAACERGYATLYGAARTALSAGGATLPIQAMLSLVGPPGARLLVARGCHGSAVGAMMLLGLNPIWMATETRDGFPEPVTPRQVEEMFPLYPDVRAVYLTSPGYDGRMADIRGIAAVCHRRGIKLLVDGAHGAHLPFVEEGRHPIREGADFCCDSLHKTLPVLTGGALLHARDAEDGERLKDAMRLFGSTSPSYLILASLDHARSWLLSEGREALGAACRRMGAIRRLCREKGLSICPDRCDPMRLALAVEANGLSVREMRAALERWQIEPELLGDAYAVFLGSPFLEDLDWERLEGFCLELLPKRPDAPLVLPPYLPHRVMGLREAFSLPSERVPVDRAEGRIAAQVKAPCPPGIPIVMPGEQIGKREVNFLKNAFISYVNVLK